MHNSSNEPPHILQWATTSPAMSLHISNNEPPHLHSPAMSHHIFCIEWTIISYYLLLFYLIFSHNPGGGGESGPSRPPIPPLKKQQQAVVTVPQITISSASSIEEEDQCEAEAANSSNNSSKSAITTTPTASSGDGNGQSVEGALWTPEIPFENLTESEGGAEGRKGACSSSLEEELDNLMDISIEIASNKRMKKEFINPIRFGHHFHLVCTIHVQYSLHCTVYIVHCPRYLQYNTVQVYNGQYSLKKNTTISIGKLLLNIYYFPPNGQHSLKWTNSLFPKMNNTPYSLKWQCHEIFWNFLIIWVYIHL